MRFEWDENKRIRNINQHSLDFLDADIVFSGPLVTNVAKTVNGEHRLMAIGMLDDVYVTAIYTMRGDVIRMISLRRARDGERKQHQSLHDS